MARTVRPDDDALRYDAVWLGPDDITLPVQARYVSWGLWLVSWIVLSVLFLLAPGFGTALDILWAFVCAVILTRVVMLSVDNDRPLSAFLPTLRAEIGAISRPEREQIFAVSLRTVRVRSIGPASAPPTTPEHQ